MERTTIALLHEHRWVRTSIGLLLKAEPDLQLVGEVDDEPGFKRSFALRPPPKLVLLSLRYEGFLPWLLKNMTDCAPMVMGPMNEEVAVRLFCAGALGCCPEACAPEEVLRMVHHVQDGTIHFPRNVLVWVRAKLPAPHPTPAPELSERQEQFLRLLIGPDSPTYPCIAERMNVCLGRVNNIAGKLCKRFQLKGKAGLVRFATELYGREG